MFVSRPTRSRFICGSRAQSPSRTCNRAYYIVVYPTSMKLTFVQTGAFASDWARLRLNDGDLQLLESMLLTNPKAGAVVAGTGGLRKVRFAPPSWHTGKSGATRVCYVHFATSATVAFLVIFGKNEQGNLTAGEKATARITIEFLEQHYG